MGVVPPTIAGGWQAAAIPRQAPRGLGGLEWLQGQAASRHLLLELGLHCRQRRCMGLHTTGAL